MANFSTYNQIVKAFNDIASAHYQVNSFGVGDSWDMATSGTTQYPLVWALPNDGSLSGKTYSSNWTLIFMDLQHADGGDVDDITSDMELVALDFIAQLQKPSYDFDFKAEGISFKRFNERFDDLVAGVAIDISINVPFTFDRCSIPSSLVNVSNGTGACAGVTITDSLGVYITTVASGGSYQESCSGGGTTITAMEGIIAYAGGGQANATALTATYNFVDTVATTGDSCKAITAAANAFQYVQNNGANDMYLYPVSGQNFSGLSANAYLVISPNASITLVCATAGTFRYF